jgi:transcription elongation factor Elf1
MGRRRRKVVHVVKRKIPKIFSCPSCGEESVRVDLSHGSRHAVVKCSACGLKDEFEVSPVDQIVDIYCKFTDSFYSKGEKPKIPKPIPEAIPESNTVLPNEEVAEDDDVEEDDEASDEQETGFEGILSNDDTSVDETADETTDEEEDVEKAP